MNVPVALQLLLPAGQRVEYKYVILEEQVRSDVQACSLCVAGLDRDLTYSCAPCRTGPR